VNPAWSAHLACEPGLLGSAVDATRSDGEDGLSQPDATSNAPGASKGANDNIRGLSAAEAPRKAQEHVRSQGRWTHPCYRAAWVPWGVP
jgi:hypothetical protein